MNQDAIRKIFPLAMPWEARDPFLFCAYHDDHYPAGNEALAPAASLAGRRLGMDFEGKDGWRMYHGDVVPGFPQHPHRGFETVTIVRRGLIDHSDSLGAAVRFGRGDVQWLTAGRGIVHSEMFPLLDRAAPNPLELFQIWLNLPSADKLVAPHFTMLWNHDIPRMVASGVEVTVVAGRLADLKAPPPPPRSWASRPDTDVAIWLIKLEPGARWTLPAAARGSSRVLYFYRGDSIEMDGRAIPPRHGVELRADAEVALAGTGERELLLLQGRPIGEPVAQHGPFVMNTRAELQQAFADYQRTLFGGWPWPSDAPVHPREEGRFARHVDGRLERGGGDVL
jgi:quercetin 2,3-dioxygenase